MNQGSLHKVWYEGEEPGVLLRAMERMYRLASESRKKNGLANITEDLRQWPIVVVGNITAGGTGKTPLVARLCELLKKGGLQPGVVSRGYGRTSRAQVSVTAHSSIDEAGDEPLLLAKRCSVPLVVDSDREAAVRAVVAQGAEVVISDDGLQRWKMPRDIEICVMDAERRFGNCRLLPAGPLREPLERLASVDYLVSNGGDGTLVEGREAVAMRLEPGDFVSLDDAASMSASDMARHAGAAPVHAMAGIGNPGRFFDTVKELGIPLASETGFPDHHQFAPGDFEGIQGTVLVTAKDAVKCAELELSDVWYLPVEAVLPREWEEEFMNRVIELCKEKRA